MARPVPVPFPRRRSLARAALQVALAIGVCAPAWSALLVGTAMGMSWDPIEYVLDRVNVRTQHELSYGPGPRWQDARVGDCTTFAVHNHRAVKALGLPSEIWIVRDEKDEIHAVVVSGKDVLDSRFVHVKRRKALERLGYEFMFKVTALPDGSSV
jgi:predicted transglutaminase-like cysteine proteinase